MKHVVGPKHTKHKYIVPKIGNNIMLIPTDGLNNLQLNVSVILRSR